MLTGKYWLVGSECIDVTTSEHALYAKNYMLRLHKSKDPLRLNRDLFKGLSQRELNDHQNRGISKRVLEFLAKKHSDARLYAIERYKWIRTRGERFYLWEFNARSWSSIRNNRKFWAAQIKARPTDSVAIFELKTNNYLEVDVGRITSRQSFATIIHSIRQRSPSYQ